MTSKRNGEKRNRCLKGQKNELRVDKTPQNANLESEKATYMHMGLRYHSLGDLGSDFKPEKNEIGKHKGGQNGAKCQP